MFSNILGGAAGFPVADLGDTISQSLRFRGEGNHLNRTQTAGNRRTFTYSIWFKKTNSGGDPDNSGAGYFELLGEAGSNASNRTGMRLEDDVMKTYNVSGGETNFLYEGTAMLRDPSSWYHFVWRWDTTQSASADRLRFYINGVQQTLTETTSFGQNSDTFVNADTVTFSIGDLPGGGARDQINGYVADVYMVDGQSLDATSFGRYQENGVWVPKNYTGTYGTNGFHLDFADSSDLGNDVSGNNNDFSATGFDTAAISSSNTDNDVDFNDTPTSNYATLNPLNTTGGDVGIQSANLEVTDVGATTAALATASIAMTSGKYYFEFVRKDVDNGTEYGIKPADTHITGNLSGYSTGVHIENAGDLYVNGSRTQQDYLTDLADDDVLNVAFDADTRQVWFGRNGTFVGDPAAGTNPAATHDVSDTGYIPWIRVVGSGGNETGAVNFGQMPFIYTAPSGFSALQTNNLAEPTIKNGKEHFEAVIYSGTNNSNSITGLEFSPDLIWIKVRDAADNHVLVDTIRGTDSVLFSNSEDQQASSFSRFTSFDSNGFTVDTSDGSWNNSSNDYVAWCWKAGGTAVSNTDGTLTSSVSANTDAGFSIVSYTGNSTLGATIGHGLSSPPECIFTKNRDTSADWAVYHVGQDATAPEDKYMALNTADTTNDAVDRWNDTAPNSTVFTVGDALQTNGADDMIAYCWHSVEGYSKFDSYVGNGDSDGTFVYLGFKPALIILKSSTSAFDWQIYDSTRSPTNPALLTLRPNQTASEVTSGNDLDILSNGFKARDNGSINNNSGSTYLYMAFAEHPFGGGNQPPVTAR